MTSVPINYGTVVYKKTAAAFDYLRNSLGAERFRPRHASLLRSVEVQASRRRTICAQHSKPAQGRTSGWFFDGLVPTTDQTDYALTRTKVHWHVQPRSPSKTKANSRGRGRCTASEKVGSGRPSLGIQALPRAISTKSTSRHTKRTELTTTA